MTNTQEIKPIVAPIRLRGGAIEDKIEDYYNNNYILVETVEPEIKDQYDGTYIDVHTTTEGKNNNEIRSTVTTKIEQDTINDEPNQVVSPIGARKEIREEWKKKGSLRKSLDTDQEQVLHRG